MPDAKPEYTVYWQPGCTSCLKTKEFLRSHGIDFVSVNVRESPGAMDELAARGVRSIPVVVRGDAHVFGQNIDDVARFVGLDVRRDVLPAAELARRLQSFLGLAAGYTAQLPAESLATALPGRARTYLDLVYHVPMIAVALLDAAAGGWLTFEHFKRKPPERIRTPADVADVTRRAALTFGQWWIANRAQPPAKLDTYYGHQPFEAVLERTVWHVGQHVRQLEFILRSLGRTPEPALDPALLEGLPLPQDVWDEEMAAPELRR